MFAAPPKRKLTLKKNPIQKQHLFKPVTTKNLNLSYTKQKLSIQPQSRIINKMASIRTLPPFVYINSDSGNNSQHKSIGYSQSDSEIWKQQYQLFDNQSTSSIANIDKQLQDVLETIRTQRNQIDTKIYKLKQKLQQIKTLNKKNKNKQYSQVSTITDYLPIHDYLQYQENNTQCLECQTQFPELYQLSAYLKQKICALGLSQHKNNDKDQNKDGMVQEYDAGIIDDSTKIKQNKIILGMLLDKLQQ